MWKNAHSRLYVLKSVNGQVSGNVALLQAVIYSLVDWTLALKTKLSNHAHI